LEASIGETRFQLLRSQSSSSTTHVITYTYKCEASLKRSGRDKLYRLTGADYRSTGLTAGSTGEAFAYGYDTVGNLISLHFAGRTVASSTPAP
jgi:hypothetical protein